MDINKSAAPVNDSASNVMDDAPMLFVQQPTMSSVALSPATSLALDNSQGTQPLPGAPRTEVTPQLHAQALDALIGQQGHLHRRYSSDGSTFRSSSTAPHSRTQSVVDASEATTHSHCSTQSGLPSSRRHNPYTPVLTPLGPVGQGDAHTPHHHPNARLQNAAVEGGLISLSPHDVGVRSFEHGTPSGPSTPAVLAAVGFKEMVASSFSASTHSIIHSRQPSLASAPTTTMPSPSAPHPGPYMDYAGATPTQAYASHRHHFNAQHHPPAMMPPLAPPLAPPPYGGAWAGQQQPDAYSGGMAYGGAVFPPPHHHHHHHHYHHYHHHHHHYFPHHAAPFQGLALDPTDASGFRPAPVPADMAALAAQQGQGHTRRGKRGGRSKRGGGGANFAADGAVQHKRTRRGCRAGQRVKEREAQIAAVTGHGHPGVTQDDDDLDGGVSDDSSDSDEA